DGIRDRNVTGVQTCALPLLHAYVVGGWGTNYSPLFCMNAHKFIIAERRDCDEANLARNYHYRYWVRIFIGSSKCNIFYRYSISLVAVNIYCNRFFTIGNSSSICYINRSIIYYDRCYFVTERVDGFANISLFMAVSNHLHWNYHYILSTET